MAAWAALGAVLGTDEAVAGVERVSADEAGAGVEGAAVSAEAAGAEEAVVGAVYRPAHWRNISMDGEMPQRRNCQAWVCPDRVRSMSVWGSTVLSQKVGSWLRRILNIPSGTPERALGRFARWG